MKQRNDGILKQINIKLSRSQDLEIINIKISKILKTDESTGLIQKQEGKEVFKAVKRNEFLQK